MCSCAGTDWVDPHDPTVIAEQELLSAANQIEAAAKKLAMLQPRVKPKVRAPTCVPTRPPTYKPSGHTTP